jgi:hypothetical protein
MELRQVARRTATFYEYLYHYKEYDVIVWNAKIANAAPTNQSSKDDWSFSVVKHERLHISLPSSGFRTRKEALSAIPAYVEQVIAFYAAMKVR